MLIIKKSITANIERCNVFFYTVVARGVTGETVTDLNFQCATILLLRVDSILSGCQLTFSAPPPPPSKQPLG